ncbi:MAG: acylphosphatase [Euryarchaeota archaeon]|nr:acylphosphatase [Euryarchaeota archaeon]
MKRAIITVKGKVQKVRYRSKVKGIADGLGIVGEVENLEDGSVRIFAEAEEGALNEFITKLKMKNHLIDVRDVSVSFEDATGEFSAFKKVISGTMYEVAERLDDAADILEKLTGAVIHGNEKIIGTIEQGNEKIIGTIEQGNEKIIGTIERGNKEVISTIDRGNAMLAEKIDAGRAENREGFGVLAEKMDGIKEDTGEIKDTLSFLNVIHQETLELREKYELLSRDVAEIKIKVS